MGSRSMACSSPGLLTGISKEFCRAVEEAEVLGSSRRLHQGRYPKSLVYVGGRAKANSSVEVLPGISQSLLVSSGGKCIPRQQLQNLLR